MTTKYYTKAFERAPEERKEKILNTAIEEFSKNGFKNSNINIIAKKAEISVGLMYKYFNAKEDLFSTCMEYVTESLDKNLEDILLSDDKIETKAEKAIRAVCQHSKDNRDYIRIYNEITSQTDSDKAKILAENMESDISKKYISAIFSSFAEGDVRQDMDPRLFAFFFADLLSSLQFAFVCDYYRERFKIYTGLDIDEMDEELIVTQLLKFLVSAFTFEK